MGLAPYLYAFDIWKKEVKWKTLVDYESKIYYDKDGLFVSYNGLSSFDKSTGNLLWSKSILLYTPSEYPGITTPAVGNYILGSVQNYTTGRGIAAVNKKTGAIDWTRYDQVDVTAHAGYGNQFFIDGYENFNQPLFASADIATGKELWRRTTELQFDKLIVIDDVVYADVNMWASPTRKGTTISYDAKTGATIDSAKIGEGIMVLTKDGKLLY